MNAETEQEVIVLGLMSGSSLDGLDLALCRFRVLADHPNEIISWEILAADTYPYSTELREKLKEAPSLSGRQLYRLDAELGKWFGQQSHDFIKQYPKWLPSLIGSHGHTIFHEPDKGYTLQIGDGASLASFAGLPTITQFRGSDVSIGGQGAPMAPLADKYLFKKYDLFLNLGGIANLSVKTPESSFMAGDISGCCQIMDRLAQKRGQNYDKDGHLAAKGKLIPQLASDIESLVFHKQPYPKSLGNAWVREKLWPLFEADDHSVEDQLFTFVSFLSNQIYSDFSNLINSLYRAEVTRPSRVMLSGGGARNTFFIQQLNNKARKGSSLPLSFESPTKEIIDFKEAALVAWAAWLRFQGQSNMIHGATGAPYATINGALYLPSLMK